MSIEEQILTKLATGEDKVTKSKLLYVIDNGHNNEDNYSVRYQVHITLVK